MTTAIIEREPIKLVADILQTELDLVDGQVMLEYEKFDISPDPGLYIALNYVGPGKIIHASSQGQDAGKLVGIDQGLNEVQQIVISHMIDIDIMSFDKQARTRKEEIPMALMSFYSKRKQEEYGMQIARNIGPMLNTSSLETTKFLNRFTMTIFVTAVYTKTKTGADYFDTIQNPEVTVNA